MEILVRGLEPGSQYVLQARSKYPNGATSSWSTTYNLLTNSDITAPNPATSLTWVVNGSGFIGTWIKPTTDSNGKPLKDFNGYQVTVTAASISKTYIVMQERFDFSFDQNVAAFGGPQPTVQVSVKVRDMVGNLSTAVTATASNPIPANIANFTATSMIKAIGLKWDASTENDFKQYEIYYSVVSSGFTPGSGNLLAVTTTPAFIFPTSNATTHYFKIRQLDVFNQGSAAYATASATPSLTTDLDTTPPGVPTGVTVSSTVTSDGSASIAVSWTAVGSANLAEYVVRYSTDQITWRYVSVPANQVATSINNLLPNTAYYVAVASVSQVNSYSAFANAGTYPITTAADTTAPSTPAAPTVSVSSSTANMAQVSHSLLKAAGGTLEADTNFLEIHASTTTGFTPDNTTLVGTIDVGSVSVAVSANFYYPTTTSVSNLYWKVKAVDRSGNKSTASAQATGVPGLILNANIADATITNAKINDLAANKITAGSGIINNLSIKSSLTLDDVNSFIKSGNYDVPTQVGWRLDQSGLTIYSGTISASALQLQNSANIAPAVFADFEFSSTYYHDTSNVPNSAVLSATSGLLLQSVTASKKTGVQGLRIYNTAITNPTTHSLYLGTGTNTSTGVNIDVDPGDYIYSIYVKKNGSVNGNVQLAMVTDAGATITDATLNSITSTSFTRYSAILTVPSGVSKVKLALVIGPQASNTGYDVVIDSIQFERKVSGSISPSPWRAPSFTVIDGGSIITGSIRSSASAVGVSGQPAWSLNTTGGMQVGDALIRGTLTIGAGADTTNSIAQSTNYVANTSGWVIRGDGTAEFNSTIVRGTLTVSGTNGKMVATLLSNYPTLYFYNANSSNWAFFNLVDTSGTNASLGINNGQYASIADGSVTLRARLWMVGPGSTSQFGHVRTDNQGMVGGQYSYTESDAYLGARTLASLERALVAVHNDGTASMETRNTNGTTQNASILMQNGALWHNTFSATSPYSADTQILQNTGIIYLQGGDGTGLNGKTLTLGGSGTPSYLHVFNEGWNTPSFSNGWGGSGFGYKLFPDGTVGFRGSFTGGTRTDNTIIFTLPSGYRPTIGGEFIVSTASGQANKVSVSTDGTVKFWTINGGTGALFTDPIRFSIINY